MKNQAFDDQFVEQWLAGIDESVPFEPYCFHNVDGDCIEFYFARESYYAARLDDVVTVYHSEESDQIIGGFIKGVRNLMARLAKSTPGFRLELRGGGLKVDYLICAILWNQDNFDEAQVKVYMELRKTAQKDDLTLAFEPCLSSS